MTGQDPSWVPFCKRIWYYKPDSLILSHYWNNLRIRLSFINYRTGNRNMPHSEFSCIKQISDDWEDTALCYLNHWQNDFKYNAGWNTRTMMPILFLYSCLIRINK